MFFRNLIRSVIVGNDKFVSSYGEFKQTMLSGYMALLGILVCSIYIVVDYSLGFLGVMPIYLAVVAFLMLSIHFHRAGEHRLANFILLPTLNIGVFLFASSESPNAGTFVFFMSNSIAAFAVFTYKDKIFAILSATLSYLLFAIAVFTDFSILPERDYNEDMRLFNIVVNFTVALPGTVLCVYLLIDINHYKGLQLEESNEQLKKANTELDRFVYSTSHDLRAPLTSLMGLINIASDSNDAAELKRYLGMMKDRIFSLDKFIKDITDYARNNRLDVHHEKVKLVALADEVWESLKFSPDAEGISFRLDIPDEIVVDSDKNRLKIILSNLLSNAIRYHDRGKDQRFIRLSADIRDRVFYLKVEDNGQGIAAEYHGRIYDMFFRANEQSKGSGLGLYIVKEALMKLSGSIQLESSPGIGSTFTIRLPNR